MRRALIGLSVLFLGGCIASNLKEVVNALGDNTSTVCVTLNSVYGTGKVLRSNVERGKVRCDMDGMSVDTSTRE